MRSAWVLASVLPFVALRADAEESRGRRQLRQADSASSKAASVAGAEESRSVGATAFEDARLRGPDSGLDISRLPSGQTRAREFGTSGSRAAASVAPPAAAAPGVKGKNVTRWQPLVTMAIALLAAAALLMLLATFLGRNAKKPGPDSAASAKAAKMLAYIAAGLGAMVALIGVMIMGMGQQGQGLIFTLTGAAVGVLAYKAAEGYETEKAEDITKKAAETPIQETSAKAGQSVVPQSEADRLGLIGVEKQQPLQLKGIEPRAPLELKVDTPPKLDFKFGDPPG